tara:strand:+ start:1700 stop:2623 length:924 start_codon:yes stop_codon:yes gene_type:complete
MAPTSRPLLIALIIAAIPIYYVFIASEGLLVQIAGAVVLLLLVSLLLFTSRQSVPLPDAVSAGKAPQVDMVGAIELPPPVLAEEGAGQRREGKLRRSRGRQETEPVQAPHPPPPIPMPTPAAAIELEDSGPQMGDNVSGLAKVYIATSDPESQMESEVENYLAHRRVKRGEIRDRIHRERRIELARRVASEVSKWTEVEDGEDISGLLENPNHGLTVLTEPEEPDPSIPQGISYVRIDSTRVVKVRVSLDVPRRPGGTPEPELPEPALPMPPPDSPMPPSLPAPDMPPPPPPPSGLPNLPPPVRPGE